MPHQSFINKEARRPVAGRIAERDDDRNIDDKWVFGKNLDMHDEGKDTKWLTYLIMWNYNNIPPWQLESNLQGCEKAIKDFHRLNPHKSNPPTWAATPVPKSIDPRQPRRSERSRRPTWKLIEAKTK